MKKMIVILLALASLVWASASFAQTPVVTYYYDDCGNRIERTMRFKKVEENDRSLANDDEKGWLADVDENFNGIPLSLYPNPTNGMFSLAFSKKMPPSLQAELCTAGGAILDTRQVKNLVEEFDLTGKPAGIYILRLTSGQKTQAWKIIKKN